MLEGQRYIRRLSRDILLLMVFVVSSCSVKDIDQIGALVPPTAAEDPQLPQLRITVEGHLRTLHLQAFGDTANPAIFVIPGGPGADFRLMLPLKALSDSFYVVFWDPRGAGLSERVPKAELTFESFIDEIDEVKKYFSPTRPINLIGHSYGGLFATRYAAEHPTVVKSLVLIEPGQIVPAQKTGYNGGGISFLDGQEFFWTNEILTSTDHEAADYKAIDLLPKSSRNFTCDHSVVKNYPMWRFGAYQYYIVTKNERSLPSGYKWSNGIENFKGSITLIAGTCGAASDNFQREYVLPYLSGAAFHVIKGAGHISIFTHYSAPLVKEIRNVLR